MQFGRVGAAVPARETDRMVLAKAQRGLDPVERDRHQTYAVAGVPGLVADPIRSDRGGRPCHKYNVGVLKFLVDGLGKGRSAVDLLVPPHGVPGLFQRLGEGDNARTIGARIADKDAERGAAARIARHKGPFLPTGAVALAVAIHGANAETSV